MVTRPAIAIIDDDDNVRISLDSLLRAYGYTVHVFNSAEQFLASDAVATMDCLISDIQMPGLNGLQMYRQLLASGYCVPVIFITASDDPAPRAIAMALGACCYLAKPFESDNLINCIKSTLNPASKP